jgi:hydroxymethylbilane synthase
MSRLRLGTRGSLLARTQSEKFAQQLKDHNPGLEIELEIITTSGDNFSIAANEGREPLVDNDSPPNLKAMFVKEIEEALLAGRIDFAVHSTKDLPAELPSGLVIAAYPEREDPCDVLVGGAWSTLKPNARVGTASLRRRIQMTAARPDLSFVTIRGNVDTRLAKLEAGEADVMVLAAAGLKRLGKNVGQTALPLDIVVPAPGQGALAIETRTEGKAFDLVGALDCATTRLEVETERRVMLGLGGGCSTPLGALARVTETALSLSVFWSDPEGKHLRRETVQGQPEEAVAMADDLAARFKNAPQ